jgi:WD40 repeat protein
MSSEHDDDNNVPPVVDECIIIPSDYEAATTPGGCVTVADDGGINVTTSNTDNVTTLTSSDTDNVTTLTSSDTDNVTTLTSSDTDNVTTLTSSDTDNVIATITPLNYQLDQLPRLIAFTSMSDKDNYFRGCKWSPDGTCLLACNNDNHIRLYNLPNELYSSLPGDILPPLTPALSVKEGEIIYDYCWYPLMTSHDYNTSCFVSSSRGSPIHLWDAYDSHLRCSYLSYNHLDEIISPYSLSFNLCGEKLYAGFRNSIKIFDTGRPGRDCTTRSLYNRKDGGQNGLISCIAMNPVTVGNYALGSYAGSVSIHSDLSKGPLFILQGLHSGATHLMYSTDGNYLYCGERKSPDITCWDVRQPTTVYRQFKRTVSTNQRIYFDLDSSGEWLATANTDGNVTFWNVSNYDIDGSEKCFRLHEDAVNGCSLHPFMPLLATSGGQWKFDIEMGGALSDDDDGEEEMNGGCDLYYDNSLRIWSLMGHSHGRWNNLICSP